MNGLWEVLEAATTGRINLGCLFSGLARHFIDNLDILKFESLNPVFKETHQHQ